MATISQTMFSNAFQYMGILIFDKISLEFFFTQGSNWQWKSITLDIGLTPTRRHAIIWANDVQFINAYMRHSASMS